MNPQDKFLQLCVGYDKAKQEISELKGQLQRSDYDRAALRGKLEASEAQLKRIFEIQQDHQLPLLRYYCDSLQSYFDGFYRGFYRLLGQFRESDGKNAVVLKSYSDHCCEEMGNALREWRAQQQDLEAKIPRKPLFVLRPKLLETPLSVPDASFGGLYQSIETDSRLLSQCEEFKRQADELNERFERQFEAKQQECNEERKMFYREIQGLNDQLQKKESDLIDCRNKLWLREYELAQYYNRAAALEGRLRVAVDARKRALECTRDLRDLCEKQQSVKEQAFDQYVAELQDERTRTAQHMAALRAELNAYIRTESERIINHRLAGIRYIVYSALENVIRAETLTNSQSAERDVYAAVEEVALLYKRLQAEKHTRDVEIEQLRQQCRYSEELMHRQIDDYKQEIERLRPINQQLEEYLASRVYSQPEVQVIRKAVEELQIQFEQSRSGTAQRSPRRDSSASRNAHKNAHRNSDSEEDDSDDESDHTESFNNTTYNASKSARNASKTTMRGTKSGERNDSRNFSRNTRNESRKPADIDDVSSDPSISPSDDRLAGNEDERYHRGNSRHSQDKAEKSRKPVKPGNSRRHEDDYERTSYGRRRQTPETQRDVSRDSETDPEQDPVDVSKRNYGSRAPRSTSRFYQSMGRYEPSQQPEFTILQSTRGSRAFQVGSYVYGPISATNPTVASFAYGTGVSRLSSAPRAQQSGLRDLTLGPGGPFSLNTQSGRAGQSFAEPKFCTNAEDVGRRRIAPDLRQTIYSRAPRYE